MQGVTHSGDFAMIEIAYLYMVSKSIENAPDVVEVFANKRTEYPERKAHIDLAGKIRKNASVLKDMFAIINRQNAESRHEHQDQVIFYESCNDRATRSLGEFISPSMPWMVTPPFKAFYKPNSSWLNVRPGGEQVNRRQLLVAGLFCVAGRP